MQVQRAQRRRQREQSEILNISLAGYTNAGKSALFNRLTAADVRAADQLFSTLDPTTRRVHLPFGVSAVLSDTVGFVRKLPPVLVEAFQTTLEELHQADLLLHVVDASSSHGALNRVRLSRRKTGYTTRKKARNVQVWKSI